MPKRFSTILSIIIIIFILGLALIRLYPPPSAPKENKNNTITPLWTSIERNPDGNWTWNVTYGGSPENPKASIEAKIVTMDIFDYSSNLIFSSKLDVGTNHQFYWYDTNGNKKVDPGDRILLNQTGIYFDYKVALFVGNTSVAGPKYLPDFDTVFGGTINGNNTKGWVLNITRGNKIMSPDVTFQIIAHNNGSVIHQYPLNRLPMIFYWVDHDDDGALDIWDSIEIHPLGGITEGDFVQLLENNTIILGPYALL